MIHKLADVQSEKIGSKTLIWQYSIVLSEAEIGENCNINCFVFVENDVIIGNNVTIKPGVQIWDGLRIKDNVFVGPNVTFTNDKRPRSKQYPVKFENTIIKNNASIGANATILGGLVIGSYSMIGAGSVVTRNVPDRALVKGNPANIVAWLNDDGSKMTDIGHNRYRDDKSKVWFYDNNKLEVEDE